MELRFFRAEQARTAFVVLDTGKCAACWKCSDVCANNVIGRINLPWHKHIRFVNSHTCTGCMKCVKVCNTGAIVKLSKNSEVL